ncbi:MAG: shikimate kinase [Planctomycetota bacterium]
MSAPARNVVLVGMPGSGKSTVGRRIASRLGLAFVDIDHVIEAAEGKTLCQIQRDTSQEAFLACEERHASSLEVSGHVVATGGSVVYSERAMRHLGGGGTVVFLDVPVETLADRLGCLETRGVIIKPGHTLADLAGERRPLYQRYADVTVLCDDTPDACADRVAAAVRGLVIGT